MKPVTSVYRRTWAPWSLASTILAAHRRNGSTLPSGTLTAPMMSGFMAGSIRRASFGSTISALMPAAGFDELGLVVQVVLRQGDEETVGLVHAVGRDPAEDHVLADALVRGLLVGHGIAGAGVQEAVVPACRSGGDVVPLDEENLQSAHRTVSRRPGTGDAAADDDDVVLVPFHLMFISLCVCSDSRQRGCR